MLLNIIIDPGSTYSILDYACAKRLGVRIYPGMGRNIELANGSVVVPKGMTGVHQFRLATTTCAFKFYVVDASEAYEVILGLN